MRFSLKTAGVLCAVLFTVGLTFAESDPLASIATEVGAGIRRLKGVKVAVLALPYTDNHHSDGPFMVSERLTNYLVKDKRLSVLERNHITQLLNELHLSETGVIDSKTAARIGQALGADVIVTGTLIDLDKKRTEINARAMLATSGKIVGASRAVMNRTWENRPTLGWDR